MAKTRCLSNGKDGMPQPHEAHLIRIFNAHGLAVGAGFLTDDTHALTCTHVVVSAMDLKAYSETPRRAN